MVWKIIVATMLGIILLYSVSAVSFKAGWKGGAKFVMKLSIDAIEAAVGSLSADAAKKDYEKNHGIDPVADLNQTIDKL